LQHGDKADAIQQDLLPCAKALKELRELRESKCTGFCRRISFISDASDRLRTLIICMILA
jgi:hypothetical protein